MGVGWEGGFLDGVNIRFNPNLNVLIGGRGAGKSTVIESLRYALDINPIGQEADKVHQAMIRRVLRSGTKISLKIRSYSPVRREYLIERTVPNPPIVRDVDGQVLNLSPRDVLPRVEVYGQHEISELARLPQKRTLLLDRFVIKDASLTQRKTRVLKDLRNNRRSVLDVTAEIRQIDDRMATLPSLEETLKRFQEAGLEDRLRERSLLVREERVLESVPERVQIFRDFLETLRQEIPIDRAFLSVSALEQLPGKEILAPANEILQRLDADLEQAAEALETSIVRADTAISQIRDLWNGRKTEVEVQYQIILRGLQKSAVDAEEFINLRGKIEELRPIRERKPLLGKLSQEYSDRRNALLAEWEDIKAEEFRALDRAARKVNRKLRNSVSVEVAAAGNREPLLALLREEVGGRLSEALEQVAQISDFSLPEFAQSCRVGSQRIQEKYRVPPAQAERLASASSDTLMRIEELELLSTTVIRLNTGPSGAPHEWQELDDLSTGQKATAILLLLLLESDSPLVIDQPEDDLDNRFITEGVVPKMRDEKRRRQFIFSTHNANIPVLGDAEQILGLTASGEAESGSATILGRHSGSIDAQPVRELVEDVLEGGKKAFETRRLKYGF